MRWRLQFIFLFLAILLCSCRHEDPNPELLDPIYSDLTAQEKSDESALESEKKKLEKEKVAEEEATPQTIDLVNARKELLKSVHLIEHLEQKVLYEQIRMRRRQAEDHLNYHNAFVAGKPWPSKEEYNEYLVNRRLNMAPRSWDEHLPKLFDRKPAAKPEPKKSGGEE